MIAASGGCASSSWSAVRGACVSQGDDTVKGSRIYELRAASLEEFKRLPGPLLTRPTPLRGLSPVEPGRRPSEETTLDSLESSALMVCLADASSPVPVRGPGRGGKCRIPDSGW